MRFVLKDNKGIPENSSFVCAFPSHGNAGQLAVDVMIATLAHRGLIERIGNIDSELVVPMTGYDEFAPVWGRTLCMPIEVYLVPSCSFVIIQQRAPCVQNDGKDFAESVLKLLQTCSCKQVYVLCGATLNGLPDEVLTSDRFFMVSTPASMSPSAFDRCFQGDRGCIRPWPESAEPGQTISASPSLLSFNVGSLVQPSGQDDDNDVDTGPVDGSPIVSAVVRAAHPDRDPVTILGKYCNEGNNLGDGIDLALLTLRACELLPCCPDDRNIDFRQLKFPQSWESLFGPPLSDHSTLF